MVSMNLLADAAAYLQRRVSESLSRGSLSPYLVAWLLADMVDLERLRVLVQSIASRIGGAQRTYQDVSELSFAAECGLLDSTALDRLREGLRWISGRTPRVDGYPADFCTDPFGLLGISLGLRKCKNATKSLDWFEGACEVADEHVTGWHSSVVALARHVVGGPLKKVLCPDVQVVAFSKGLLDSAPSATAIANVADELQATALSKMDDVEAVLRLAALRQVEASLPRLTLHHATVADVVEVLRGIPSGLQRWTWESKGKTSTAQARKWHVDHEYHVQNLVWLVLSPLFPDARYEENKSAVGIVHPRLDIVVASLRLIVEVKFWRKSAKAEQMIRELAEDASLYLTTDTSYNLLVPFVWDDAARTEEHPLLVSGLKAINGISDVVVVSRPARMH
jgi:hypothetical protein